MTEGVLLGALGGVLGGLVAVGGLKAFDALAPDRLPRLSEITVEGHVLLYAVAISATTSVLFSLLPALRGSKAELAASLEARPRGRGGSMGEMRTR
jgi:hypothetical protein